MALSCALLLNSRRLVSPSQQLFKLCVKNPSFPVGASLNGREFHKTLAAPSAEGRHATHWVAERAVAIGLFAVIPAAYFAPQSFAMDTALTTSLVLHAHWGISSVFGDYMHGYPSETGDRRLPILTTMAKTIPYILSITAFACLTNFNYNDVGLVNAIAMLWRV